MRGRFTRITLLAPCLFGAAVWAQCRLKLDRTVTAPRGSIRLAVDGVPPEQVAFRVLDAQGRDLAGTERGAFLPADGGWIWQAPDAAGTLRLTLRAQGADGSADECKITVAGWPHPAAGVPGPGVLAPGAEDLRKELRHHLKVRQLSDLVCAFLGPEASYPLVGGAPFFKDGDGPEGPGAVGEVRTSEIREPLLPDRLGRRYAPQPLMESSSWPGPGHPKVMSVAGYGRPYPLRLGPGAGPGSVLCTYRDLHSGERTCLEAGDAPGLEVTFTGCVDHLRVEDLRWWEDVARWERGAWSRPIVVRGLSPLAEVPEAPGAVAGRGRLARHRPILGLAYASHLNLVFSEQGSDDLRSFSGKGDVRTLAEPGGYVDRSDDKGREVRFRQPGALVHGMNFHRRKPGRDWEAFYVADTGNDCIRLVEPGHRQVDTLGAGALLNPQGLWLDERCGPSGDPWLVVSDTGHCRILVILASGEVRALAGSGVMGSQDGPAERAQFTWPKGIAGRREHERDRDDWACYYVLDQHALRRVERDGSVRTLLGAVDRAGFTDSPAAGPGVPCLDSPTGLLLEGDHLFIADTGNHALRRYNVKDGSLATLAGDRTEGRTRWGLLRDGLKEWPASAGAEAYAALDAPRALVPAYGSANPDDFAFVVGTGTSLGLVNGTLNRQAPAEIPSLSLSAPKQAPEAGQPLPLTFTLFSGPDDATRISRHEMPFNFEYFVTCTDREEELPIQGRGHFGAPVSVQLPALPAGEHGLRVRCVTLDGYSVAERVRLVVQDPVPAGI